MHQALLLSATAIARAHDAWLLGLGRRRPLAGKVAHLEEQVVRLEAENALLRARFLRVPPRRRPHYRPAERLDVLCHAARYRRSVPRTAHAFGLSVQTVLNWRRVAHRRRPHLLPPLRGLPDLVRELVQRLKAEWPRWGTRRIERLLLAWPAAPMRPDRVVPVAMERVRKQADARHLLVGDLHARRIVPPIQLRVHLQPGRRARAGNQLEDRRVGVERLATPALRAEREQAMLDLVPLARPGRQMTDRDRQPAAVGEPLQFPLPLADAGPVASTAVYRQGRCTRRGLARSLESARRSVQAALRRGTGNADRQAAALCKDVVPWLASLWTFTRVGGVVPDSNAAYAARGIMKRLLLGGTLHHAEKKLLK